MLLPMKPTYTFFYNKIETRLVFKKTLVYFIQSFQPTTGTTGTAGTATSGFDLISLVGAMGRISSLGSATLTLSGKGFFGPSLPVWSHGNIIFTLIPKTPINKMFNNFHK